MPLGISYKKLLHFFFFKVLYDSELLHIYNFVPFALASANALVFGLFFTSVNILVKKFWEFHQTDHGQQSQTSQKPVVVTFHELYSCLNTVHRSASCHKNAFIASMC